MTNISVARSGVGSKSPESQIHSQNRLHELGGLSRFNPRLRAVMCAAVAFLATTVLLVRAALLIPTYNSMVDEPYHVVSAVALWDLKTYAIGFQQPPLTRYPAMIALAARGVHMPNGYNDTSILNDDQIFSLSPSLLFDSKLSYEQLLFTARYAMLFWPAAAMFFLYILTRWLAGDVAAASAVVLFSLDPTFLGHCVWVGTEPGIIAMFLAATYFGLKWILRQSWQSAIWAGVFFGLGMGAKFTCLFLLPALGVAWLIRPWLMKWGGAKLVAATEKSPAPVNHSRFSDSEQGLEDDAPWQPEIQRSRWQVDPGVSSPASGPVPPAKWGGWRFARQAVVMGLVAFVTLWGVYFFTIAPMGHQRAFADQKQWQAIPQVIKDTPIPMPSFFMGMMRAIGHGKYGHPAYLDGQFNMHGWTRYFPEALLLKLPAATLVGLVIAVFAQWFLVRRLKPTGESQHRLLLISVLVLLPFAAFMGMAMHGTIDIGIRHILPIMPLVSILVVAPLARMGRMGMCIVAGIACMMIAETSLAHPNYIAFFNPIAGGMTGGQNHLLDSNLDWGQDFKSFAQWAQSPDVQHRKITSRLFIYPQWRLFKEYGLHESMQNARPEGLFAISINVKRGLIGAEIQPDGSLVPTTDYSWLKDYPLVHRIGGSIEVYDLDQPLVAHAAVPPQMPPVSNGFNVDGSDTKGK